MIKLVQIDYAHISSDVFDMIEKCFEISEKSHRPDVKVQSKRSEISGKRFQKALKF